MKARTLMKRLLSLLMAVVLCLGLTPVTAWAANFPSKFYAHLMNNSGMGTVSSSLNYTSKNTEAQQVHGMEYAGGAFFTVVGNKDDDGWRELRMYNSNLTNYRTIGTVSEGNYAIVDTAMDLSDAMPALYGTYNTVIPDVIAMSMICTIDLETATPGNYLQVTGLPDMHIIYAIAFDKDGTLYAIGADAGDDGGPATLYTIDLDNVQTGSFGSQTVQAQEVGAITSRTGNPISTNYCQDLAFDHATNTLYWAENDGNVLYALNTTTAVATYVGQVKYSGKAYPVQSFCIPYDTAFGQNDGQYMISVICEGAGKVTSGGENKPFYMVDSGDDITLNIELNEGGTDSDLLGVTVDGQSIPIADLQDSKYTFSNVTENHVVEVKLKKEIPAEQNTVTWLHYQGEPASFYTKDNVYKFYDLPYLDKEVPREGYTQTLYKDGQPIEDDEIIIPGNYDAYVTHPGNAEYAALDVIYEDALQLAKCPGTPGRPVVYGKVGCTQGDLSTTSALQDYYGTDGKLIDAAHDEIPVTLVWQNPETIYDTAGNFYATATINAADELEQRLKDCYTLDDGSPLTEDCQISPRATQVVVLPEAEASLIKLQTSDASGGTVSGKGVYKNGTEVTVTAAVNANDGYEFKGWQENGQIVSGAGETYTFEADGDRTLTALFETNSEYRVTLNAYPQGAGTVTGGGSYDAWEHKATVTATPNQGYYFIGWYKDGQAEAVSTDAEHAFTVEKDGITLTAKFGIDYLARAEQARVSFESAVSTDAFEWQTLVQAVDAYESAKEFVSGDELPSSIENAEDRFNELTTYYNNVETLDLSDQGINSIDLAKLYLFTGVTDLNLSGNKDIAELSALKDLKELEALDISGTGVTALDSLVTEGTLKFPGSKTLTAKNLILNSISALAQLVDVDDFNADRVTKWDFTDSTLPGTEGNKANVDAIQAALSDAFIPPTLQATPDPTPTPTPGGGGGTTAYGVAVVDCEHGKISTDPAKAVEGDTVTITVTPDEGFEVRSVSVTDAGGNAVEVSRNDDGTFSFEMPAGNVTVSAAFGCDGGAHCPSHGFADVDQSQWYHDVVDWAVTNGVMGGFGNGLFGPDMDLSRAQMAQILWSIEGKPAVDYLVTFGDVGEGDWHRGAVAWAASEGVFEGYDDGSGLFGPDDSLTREQAAAVLMRWAASSGEDTSARADLSSYPDVASVSGWATECVSWAVAEGVISGVELPDGTLLLDPTGTSSRAMAAALMMRLIG